MLPASFYELHYDAQSGEVLAFWNPMKRECDYSPVITISVEDHARVSAAPHKFLVVNGKIEERAQAPAPVSKPTIDVTNALIAGCMVGDVCYAINANALSVLLLDLACDAQPCRAVAHTSDGNTLVKLVNTDARQVASTIAEHLASLYCG